MADEFEQDAEVADNQMQTVLDDLHQIMQDFSLDRITAEDVRVQIGALHVRFEAQAGLIERARRDRREMLQTLSEISNAPGLPRARQLAHPRVHH